jgi:WhiB family redox-sensing transcriptional regulator
MRELAALVAAQSWQSDALCRELPYVEEIDWFPERGEYLDVIEAKECCARCLVREECLAFALERKIKFGICDGTSENERRALRKHAVAR